MNNISAGLDGASTPDFQVASRCRRRTWCFLVCAISSALEIGAANDPFVALTDAVEEVRVSAVAQCGSWPIAHADIVGCEYAELKPEMLKNVRKLRAEYLTRCLRCKEGTCIPRAWTREQVTARNLCKRLYMTPTKVPAVSSRSRVTDASLLVRFRYSISNRGRVEGIRLDVLDSDLTEPQVIEMIRGVARYVRFEPLKADGEALSIVDLRDGYTLTGIL